VVATRATISARIVKNLRGTFASLENDVVPLGAICAMGNQNPRIDSIPRAIGALKDDS
jgi:hypothetical protein